MRTPERPVGNGPRAEPDALSRCHRNRAPVEGGVKQEPAIRPAEGSELKGLLESARGGCTVAIAAIFVIAGNWSSVRGGNEGVMRRAISILTAEDGCKILKSEL
ncbi:MAG TPA: hypothetical protein VGM87_09425 [Roseomonas sp.]|jgi:hypothetical protein